MTEFDVKKDIIRLFEENSGSFVSGEQISDILGFSRASCWKYITKLREEGFSIEAVPHLGYRLRSCPDRMYGYVIGGRLNTGSFGKKDIIHYDTTGSTNDEAYLLGEKGAPEGTVVLAERQSSGKGRMGRKWVSPKGCGIYMSVILRPDLEMDEVPAITLVAAASVVASIKKTCAVDARIKWPNDVFVRGRKVCGILTEMKAQPDRIDFLVLGMGLNVNTPENKLPEGAASLMAEKGKPVDRLAVLQELLEQLEKDYTDFINDGFPVMIGRCRELSMVLGKDTVIKEHAGQVEGRAEDIDEKGALMVRTRDGSLKRVFSGDVHLCRKTGGEKE